MIIKVFKKIKKCFIIKLFQHNFTNLYLLKLKMKMDNLWFKKLKMKNERILKNSFKLIQVNTMLELAI